MFSSLLGEQSFDGSVDVLELDVGTIWDQQSLFLEIGILGLGELGESPLVRNDDFLASWELVHGSGQGRVGLWDQVISGSDGE